MSDETVLVVIGTGAWSIASYVIGMLTMMESPAPLPNRLMAWTLSPIWVPAVFAIVGVEHLLKLRVMR